LTNRSAAQDRPVELGNLEKPTPFADVAFMHIRRELLPGGALFNTSRLVELDLAKRLGMSRTPVREALHRLALVGILEPAPGGGYALRRFSRREIEDHYELRILLEPVAAQLAAQLPAQLRRTAAEREPDLVTREISADANTRFHKAVARLAANRSLARIIEQLVDRLAREGVHARGSPQEQRVLAAGHGEIVKAMVNGNAADAASSMRTHLRMTLDILLGSQRPASLHGQKSRTKAIRGDGDEAEVARARLGEGAYVQLRAAILDGRLAAGSLLAETAIAKALNVSRTPTRFALRQLEAEGYADRDERGRLVVHRLSRRELEELFLVRSVVEAQAARLAAAHISDEELDRLDHLLAADLDALRAGDVGQLAALNEQIHAAVLNACRSRALVQVAEEVRERVYGFGFSAFAVGQRKERGMFVADHAALVRAIRDGEPEIAASVVERHIDTALRLLADQFERYESRRRT
jgi:DNA-binding GntR family transcriptional regulator